MTFALCFKMKNGNLFTRGDICNYRTSPITRHKKDRSDSQDQEKAKSMVVIPYISGCTEKLQCIFWKQKTATAVKPYQMLRQISVNPKDKIKINEKCIVVYSIPKEHSWEIWILISMITQVKSKSTKTGLNALASQTWLKRLVLSKCGTRFSHDWPFSDDWSFVVQSCGCVPTSASDHFFVYAVRKKAKVKHPKFDFVGHAYSKLKKDAFVTDVTSHDWSPVLESNDNDQSWNIFKNAFLSILGVHWVLTEHSRKR